MRDDGNDEEIITVYNPFGPYLDKGREHWRIVVKVRNRKSGQVTKRNTRAGSEEEARAIFDQLQARLKEQEQAPPSAVVELTVGEARAAWRAWKEQLKRVTPNRAAAIRSNERRLGQLLPPDHSPLNRRTITRITQTYNAYAEAGTRAPRTVRAVRNLLKGFGELLKRKRMLPTNPWASLEAVELPAGVPERRRLAVGEALQLWAECRRLVLARSKRPYWTGAVHVALLLGTGMRVGDLQDAEVRGLQKWGDQEFMLCLFQGKTNSAARTIMLGSCPWLVEALLECAAGREPTDSLFTTGLPLKPEDLQGASLAEVARKTGFHWRTVRTLRTQPLERRPLREGSTMGCAARRMCRELKITVVGPHGLRRTNTDLRDLVAEKTLASAMAESSRRDIGHRPGSSTMEGFYLSPDRLIQRDAFDTRAVLRFLEASTTANGGVEPQPEAPMASLPGSTSQTLKQLVDEIGAEQLLKAIENLHNGR